MSDLATIRAGVEATVRGYGAEHDVVDNGDGSWTIREGSTRATLRVVAGPPDLVHIEASVIEGVPCTADLLAVLNEINTTARFARAYWQSDRVVLATELIAGLMTGPELDYSLRTLARLADGADDELQKRFGGRRGTD